MSNATVTKVHPVVTEYPLIYRCLTCADYWHFRWGTDRPQERELMLGCGTCRAETNHRIAGLGPLRRFENCPEWCTDHNAWTFGSERVEQHRHLIAYDPYKHLGSWKCFTVDIAQYEDHPLVKRADEKVPHIDAQLSTADLGKCRLLHALIGQAIELIS